MQNMKAMFGTWVLFMNILVLGGTHAQAEYSKLSFPSSTPFSFFPYVVGVDHNEPTSPNNSECLNFQGRRNFPNCYAGHDGMDFPIVGSFLAMHIGVDVRAATGGVVVHKEDGYGDHCFGWFSKTKGGGPEIRCLDNPDILPNYIVVLQDDGLYAFYHHFKKNSIRVDVDHRVECGDFLGKVGSSGNSSAPHIHFELRKLNAGQTPETLRYFDVRNVSLPIDPFKEGLWNKVVGKIPTYGCR